jgi:hypothetical protein
MRKSTRLSSIYDDDEATTSEQLIPKPNSAAASAASSKKFAPTIPAARRKKIVEDEEQPSAAKTEDDKATFKPTALSQARRKPLISSANVSVSGPLAMGPAGMTLSATSSSSQRSAGIISGRTQALSTRLQSTTNDFYCSALQVEDEFAVETGLSPIIVNAKPAKEEFKAGLTDGLLLLQVPPVMPRMTAASAAEVAPENISGMFDLPQADHWPSSVQGRYGTLKQYRSGRLILELLNGFELELVPSIEEEKLMSVLAVDSEFGQSFNLGAVEHHFVCTPDLDK